MQVVRQLAIITTLATFALISIGGFVRASGAGLGCPDWPKCFGRWIPPTSVEQLPDHIDPELFNFTKAWIEYINRLVGVAIGLLIFATFVAAFRKAKRKKSVFPPIAAALVLVAFQGWLGGRVVKYELDPRFVTVHLIVALVIAGLLVFATFNTYNRSSIPALSSTQSTNERRLRVLNGWSIACCLIQIILGALVRGGLELAAKIEPPLPRDQWILEVGWADMIHRKSAGLLALLIVVSFFLARRLGPKRKAIQRTAALNLSFVSVQVAAGLGLAYGALPPTLQVIHLTVGCWLAGGLFIQWLLHRQTGQEAASALAEVAA